MVIPLSHRPTQSHDEKGSSAKLESQIISSQFGINFRIVTQLLTTCFLCRHHKLVALAQDCTGRHRERLVLRCCPWPEQIVVLELPSQERPCWRR